MKYQTRSIIAALSLLLAGPALGADEEVMASGEALYDQWCVICHGPDERGTAILEDRYQGSVPGELIKRENLTPELITLRVRTWNALLMPVFRPTEISDEELEVIITYLTNLHTE